MRGWRVIRDRISEAGRVLRRRLGHPDMRSLRGRTRRLEQSLRSTLARNYPTLKRSGIDSPAPETEPSSLYQFESGCHSQNGEDGCLLEILQRTGFEGGRIVEIGCGAGVESNAALLVCEFGWQGYLIDANADQIEKAEQFYDSENAGDRVKFRHGMVTPDNAESMLKDLLEGETADVISIDVDGWDFWIWQSLKKFKPAVFVIEVNASFGPDVSVTVPYEGSTAGHDPFRHEFRGWHHGASLKALTALGSSLGYRLVHVESTGTNAFYVRRDLMGDSLLAADPAQVWRPHQFRSRRHTPEAQASTLARTPGVEIRGDGAPRL
jgi:predicted O-methyltransferase YrrM